MMLVPAVSGRRTTARPRVRPQPPAPAFVNDEARAIARHVSRDVCGARIRALDHPGGATCRTDCAGRAADAGDYDQHRRAPAGAPRPTRRKPRGTRRPTSPRPSGAAGLPAAPDRRHLPHAQDNTGDALGTPIPKAQRSGGVVATCLTPRRVAIPSERARGFRLWCSAPATNIHWSTFVPTPLSVLRVARRQVSRQPAGEYTVRLSRPLLLAVRRSGHRARLPFAAAACVPAPHPVPIA